MSSDDYEEMSQEDLLGIIGRTDVNQPAGFAIEVYRERFPITEAAVPILERFLVSTILDNRSAAIQALVNYGKRTGYVVDALVLHFLSRDECFSAPDSYASLRSIQQMSELGDGDADRALTLLRLDPYVQHMMGSYAD